MPRRQTTHRPPSGREQARSPFEGLTILVTGGTGSFGTAFAKHVLSTSRDVTLRIFSRDELKQLLLAESLQDPRVRYLLGDVRDRGRLKRALAGVDVVIHAAALKQVPACEYNPFEAVRTNVIGAQNVIDACIDVGVKRVLAISTDKAVNPINLYGATKLCAEKLFVDGNAYAGREESRFSLARYGNVVGSRGSVIPLFLKQRASGRLTITDERMTRFWITLPQATRFVADCVAMMKGGEIFIPKIPSMRVTDLARVIAPEARLDVVGIRPGEKLHEILLTEEESRIAFEMQDRILVLPEVPFSRGPVYEGLDRVAEGFRYTSDTNAQWLSVDELSRMVRALDSAL